MSERLRVENVLEDGGSYRTHCLTCHKPITLYYNGGELDGRSCCGLAYELQTRGTDFVVRDDS